MSKNQVSPSLVQKIADLAAIPITQPETTAFAQAFSETLDVVDQLRSVDTSKTPATSQVTGLTNVWRQDLVTPETGFTQAQALANAKQTHQGFFVVPGVLKNKDT